MSPKCVVCYCDINQCSDDSEVKYEVQNVKSLLSQHLDVIFLLKDIFQVPRNQLTNYLGKCPQIEEWIVTCKKCQVIVQCCISIYRDLLNVTLKLQKSKLEIIEIVKKSYDFAEKRRSCINDNLDITDSCRKFASQYEFQNVCNPFTEGDLEALNLELSRNHRSPPSPIDDHDDNIEDNEPDSNVVKDEESNHKLLASESEPTPCQRQHLPKFKRRIHPSKRKFPPEQYDEFGKRKRVRINIKSTCKLCGHVFASKQNLKVHVRRVHELKFAYHCKTCGLGKRYQKEMEKHELICSKGALPVTEICPEKGCKAVVSRHTGFETHFRDKHPTRPFFDVCTECQQGCYTKSGLRRHMTKIHKKRERDSRLDCEHCGIIFKTKYILETHQKVSLQCKLRYMSESEATMVCEMCAGRFSSEYNLKNHIKMMHENQYKHKCEHCEMGFSEKESLKVHLFKKHAIKDLGLKFTCTVEGCGRVFCKGKFLEYHMAQHEGRPQFTCEECGKQFYDKRRFSQHRYIMHESRRREKVKCDICGAEFGCRDYLLRHKRTVHKIIPVKRQEKTFVAIIK